MTLSASNNTFHWQTTDGLKIHAKNWHVNDAKAVILIVHGLGEHCERYANVASFFNKQKIGVVGYDRRGHGRSEGKRGHTISYEALLDEVEQLLQNGKKLYPEKPVFIYGHSMGGNIALNFVLKRKAKISGLIISGAWIDLVEKPSSLLVGFAKIINNIFPSFTQSNGLDPKNISTDPTEVEKYINDPLVHNKITSNTGLEMIKAADFLKTFDGKMPVPTLMMHGQEDKIVSPKGSRNFSMRINGDLTFKEWEGSYHEIHNELNQNDVFNYTLKWINQTLEK